jgi:hypothetical protein
MKYAIATIEGVLSLFLLALAASAWAYDWATGIAVTGIVAAILYMVWGALVETWND